MRNRPTFRVGARLRWLLACGIAVLGLAVTQVFVSGSGAALQATTTIPTPDAPPTTSPQPTPPPPAQPAPKRPPASPPPAPPPAPSPLPPPAPSSPPPAVSTPVHPPKPVQHRERRAVKHLARPRGPSPSFQAASLHPQSSAALGAGASTLGRSSPSNDLRVVIVAIAFALSLIAVGAAFAPAWAVPGFALGLLERHRSEVALTGVVVMLGVCVALLVVLVLT